eukprot:TRINITY_DN6774_c0_g1_i2.p1 TRINITY_DN6774_c0_g1~~TRINITY_DN6774_c0_g1_i2.p1  ORF type:complete len:562 (-),score=73.82 TRINITY_DN6774_c0_g1_i2:53-1738(-)
MAFGLPFKQLIFSVFLVVVSASGDGFLSGRRGHMTSSVSEFRSAMEHVLGCGGDVEHEHLQALTKKLMPMWRVLPKADGGLVEWKMVRFLAHRYFVQKSSLLIRGFEPIRQINSSSIGAAQIIETHVPSMVSATMQSEQATTKYSLGEVVTMIATLDQLIRDDEATRLEKVYRILHLSPQDVMPASRLTDVLETYMLLFIMDGDQETLDELLATPTLRSEVIPKWADIQTFVNGLVKETEFGRHQFPKHGHASVSWYGLYSFVDGHGIVSRITESFASFWEDECQTVKRSLVALDRSGTGRVSLTSFYAANSNGEWRFGESEGYLRDLGALDESSAVRGKQVIIPNYLQGASNCIVATHHFLVCCVSECEVVLNEIEESVGGPFGQPEDILSLISGITGFDDESTKIDIVLRDQLQRIAETHGGKVPLHGRLFTQWLHYAFPRECPFPHRTGSRTAHAPHQYGNESLATDNEIASHAAADNQSTSVQSDLDDVEWMSQWSQEEELLTDDVLQLEKPWGTSRNGVFAFGAVLLVLFPAFFFGVSASQARGNRCEWATKSHMV